MTFVWMSRLSAAIAVAAGCFRTRPAGARPARVLAGAPAASGGGRPPVAGESPGSSRSRSA